MEKYTYGLSKAAVTLYEITKAKPTYQRKVARILSEFQVYLNEISKIEDKKIRAGLLHITYEHFKDRVGFGKIKFEDDEVMWFLLSVLNIRFKNAIKDF